MAIRSEASWREKWAFGPTARRRILTHLIEQRGLGCFGGRGARSTGEVARAFVDLDDPREAVGVFGTLVPADSFDPRESQGVATGVTGAFLDLIAGDLQHHLRWHRAHAAA